VKTLSVAIEEARELTPTAISHLLDLQERVLRRLASAPALDDDGELEIEDAT
jgi:hypothetical protein